MFFIFVLLYVAFATILNLNGVKTKEMIITVIVVGLLMNFSLFTTRVIIDASNILARVFYNSNAITVTLKGSAGDDASSLIARSNESGIIPLSAALVNKVDPQAIILEGRKISKIETESKITDANKSLGEEESKSGKLSTGTWILIILLASAVNVVGLTVFLSVAMIFIVRVVGLWFAIIFAPLAFFSYTVPALGGIKKFGHKSWWPETLKLAFLAPVFIFFLYLIIGFLEKGLNIIDARNESGMTFVIAIILPFAFIMILLVQAKKIAIEWSGEMGAAVAKAGAAVGGLAVGAATGGAALMMRGTIGAAGSAMKNSKWAQKWAGSDNKTLSFIGNKAMDAGGKLGSKAFDIRNTSIGKAAGTGLGVDMGKAKEGGFEGAKARQIAKDQQRAKELEPGQKSQVTQDLQKTQETLKILENKHNRDIEPQEARVAVTQQEWSNANSALLADKDNPAKITAENDARKELDKEKAKLFDIKNGGLDTTTGLYRTTNGNISDAMVTETAKNFTTASTELVNAIAVEGASSRALVGATKKLDTIQKALADISSTGATAQLSKANSDAAVAATKAAAPGASATDAINHTNALAIQSAAQAKMDKLIDNEQAAIAAEIYANTAYATATTRLTQARTKEFAANVANTTAIATAARAMAPGGGGLGRSINETKFTDLKKVQKAWDDEGNEAKLNYAKHIRDKKSKIFNYLTTAGTYSPAGADIAAHNIIMDVKTQ